MKTTVSGAALRWGLAVALLGAPAAVSGQVADPLVKAKALYAEAAYEEALTVLRTGDGPEAHQYRALCFIALGRQEDAERAIESLIRSAPSYVVTDAELPPRLVNLFAQTRKRVMPDVVRELFASARADFQAKELQRAGGKFEQVLALLKDPSMAGIADAKDLQLLTTGYLDIVKNTPPPAPVPSKPAAPAAATATPAVQPKPVVPRPVKVEQAVTIQQTIPPFQSMSNSTRTSDNEQERVGAVRVVIGVDGRVTSATIERPIEPRFDAQLLAAARNWRYRPATRNGQPVESEKIVEIRVTPR
jgi:TonB family protein